MDNNLKKLEFDKILDNLSKYCKTYIRFRAKAITRQRNSTKNISRN